jgi:hypothetical protein
MARPGAIRDSWHLFAGNSGSEDSMKTYDIAEMIRYNFETRHSGLLDQTDFSNAVSMKMSLDLHGGDTRQLSSDDVESVSELFQFLQDELSIDD